MGLKLKNVAHRAQMSPQWYRVPNIGAWGVIYEGAIAINSRDVREGEGGE